MLSSEVAWKNPQTPPKVLTRISQLDGENCRFSSYEIELCNISINRFLGRLSYANDASNQSILFVIWLNYFSPVLNRQHQSVFMH